MGQPELSALTHTLEQRFKHLETTLSAIQTEQRREAKAAARHRQRSARKLAGIEEASAWQLLISDLAYYGVVLGVVIAVDAYAFVVDTVPPWLKRYIPNLRSEARPAAVVFRPSDQTPLQRGEQVAGFPVSSPRGWRDIGDGREFHAGVDLETPIGTPLYAVIDMEVVCFEDDGGGGLVAEFALDGSIHKFLHLSECFAGQKSVGESFALTGDSGRSTGPHLDYRVKAGDQWQVPYRDLLAAVLMPVGKVPASAVSLIKAFEGFLPTPYWDEQRYSIGYGTPAGQRTWIDEPQAERELIAYATAANQTIDALIQVPLAHHERIALISFEYNTGGLRGSTLVEKLNRGDRPGAAQEFDRWIHGENGQELTALKRRRAKEREVFQGGR
ncbi:MAG: peptidoglycan DD-metalloendopeptidase family protein [Leptolyngbya sp. SIO4C1]|nr:peptidoglycan DD-metalloendopeptidase family protein [Leptolyngbya sp. SIO4C1]